ncbi:tRNA pseudouridine(55) synthase TruB [Myxococcota bacterium]|nr:tRNA pseudouridine(55) synthase TruB [Myxococcota bacterium]
MKRRRRRAEDEAPGPAGFLVVDKPSGWTSHDVVDAARRWLGTRRVGHLGTLDPLATGVLPLAIREATKLVPFLQAGAKSYRGSVRLGEETNTLDADGVVIHRSEAPLPDEAALHTAAKRFVGEIQQVPPMFSAVKRDGVPLHRLARAGKEVERPPKTVTIDRLELSGYEPPEVSIEVDCSAGTYVRALAADLGTELGCGGHLASLRRTLSGPFTEDQAVSPEQLAREAEAGEIAHRFVHPINALGFPVLRLRNEEVGQVAHGAEIEGARSPVVPGTLISAIRPDGALLAIMEMAPGRRIRPVRVLKIPAPKETSQRPLAPPS